LRFKKREEKYEMKRVPKGQSTFTEFYWGLGGGGVVTQDYKKRNKVEKRGGSKKKIQLVENRLWEVGERPAQKNQKRKNLGAWTLWKRGVGYPRDGEVQVGSLM